MPSPIKPVPKSILIFGAASRTATPLADFLSKNYPEIKLRLTTSTSHKKIALRGMEGVYVVAPAGTDERRAMGNLATALKESDTLVHVVRLLGMFPEFNLHRIPIEIREEGTGLAIQHPIAKSILDESGLPVTYINSGATFIDNFWLQIKGIKARKLLIWLEHRVPFIDPRKVGEVAGRLLVSDDARHIGLFHTMNNGSDYLQFNEVTEIVKDVLGITITYSGSREDFVGFFSPVVGDKKANSLWTLFQFEAANEVCWALNNFVERTLGRKPKTVRDWLLEHKETALKILSS